MALGPYAHPGTIGEAALDGLLASYNSLMVTPFGVSVTDSVNTALFSSPTAKIPYQSDTTTTSGNVQLTSGTQVFLEYGNTGADTIDLSTNSAPALVIIGATNSMNFVDMGSSADTGDTVVGSDGANQYIGLTQGANLLIAGTGTNTLVAGSSANSDDSIYGGGKSDIVAGSGAVHFLGGIYATAHDTLIGGSGTDRMKVKFGENSIIAGSGSDTITTLDRGDNGVGGDAISLLAGGNAFVDVKDGGSATATVTFGGTEGNDTIAAAGAVVIDIASTESLSDITAAGGVTTMTFTDGQTLTYSGTGSITLHFGA